MYKNKRPLEESLSQDSTIKVLGNDLDWSDFIWGE